MPIKFPYSLLFNQTTRTFNLTYQDLQGLAQYVRLEVDQIKYNETSFVACNKKLFSTVGQISCDVSAYDGNFYATAYINRGTKEQVFATLSSNSNTLLTLFGKEGLLLSFY